MPLNPTPVTVEALVAHARKRIADAPPDLHGLVAVWLVNIVDGNELSAQFHIVSNGETVSINDGNVDEYTSPDVTLATDTSTFIGIATGTVNPQTAYLTRRLLIDGPVTTAMQLGAILRPS